MQEATTAIDLSVIVPVGERHDEIQQLYLEYKKGIVALAIRSHEFIFVLDGPRHEAIEGLKELIADGEPIIAIALTRPFGESTAVMAGFSHARGRIILTLPGYHQIRAEGIPRLMDAVRNADMACGRRSPRAGGSFDRLRRWAFHRLLRWVCRHKLRDLGCGARAMRRQVLEEITLYGDQHRFFPLLAYRYGFNVVEVDVPQSPQDQFRGQYRPAEYVHRLLDMFTLFFLVRFTKKPLRFFGFVGLGILLAGSLVIGDLVSDRLFFGQPLSERPALLLSSLMVVLGVQLIALGLLGELIIFAHARDMKDYQVAQIIHFQPRPEAPPGISSEQNGSAIREAG